jgi:hypothetical protein
LEKAVGSSEPFALFDCTIALYAMGRSCTNLREPLEVVRTGSDATLEHHMMHCALDDHFELHEFPIDLARWCWDGLGDDALGEQLALIDSYKGATAASSCTTPASVFATLGALAEALPTLSLPSLFQHVHQVRRRNAAALLWLNS